ncbi:MAG: 50S ribosomal protein L25 [Acidobacteria bacterium]|nr:50S ribosomal protein L25 [Acidobacteriota bacterium]
MAEMIVNAEPRKTFGKNANRQLRRTGKIPAVVYGEGMAPLPISVDPKDVIHILHSETGHNTIFKLSIDGSPKEVLIKEYQLHPVQGRLLHADFQAIAMDRMMEFKVPIEAVGVPKGVKETGGVLDIVLREVEVECLPRDVPDRLRVEVSSLAIGDSIRVENIPVDHSKIRVLSDAELVVVTVVPPHIERVVEAVVEPVAAEPEVIKKGKAEEGKAEGEEE